MDRRRRTILPWASWRWWRRPSGRRSHGGPRRRWPWPGAAVCVWAIPMKRLRSGGPAKAVPASCAAPRRKPNSCLISPSRDGQCSKAALRWIWSRPQPAGRKVQPGRFLPPGTTTKVQSLERHRRRLWRREDCPGPAGAPRGPPRADPCARVGGRGPPRAPLAATTRSPCRGIGCGQKPIQGPSSAKAGLATTSPTPVKSPAGNGRATEVPIWTAVSGGRSRKSSAKPASEFWTGTGAPRASSARA